MDYANLNTTFPNLNANDRANLGINIGGGGLASGQSTWISLPDDITASEITLTPEPGSCF